jgi:hypothetical protein
MYEFIRVCRDIIYDCPRAQILLYDIGNLCSNDTNICKFENTLEAHKSYFQKYGIDLKDINIGVNLCMG